MDDGHGDGKRELRPRPDEQDRSRDVGGNGASALSGAYSEIRKRRVVEVGLRVLLMHVGPESPRVKRLREVLQEGSEAVEIEEAGSRAGALARLDEPPPPDIIFVDSGPKHAGLEILGESAPRARAPLWVLVASKEDEGLANDAFSCGADDILFTQDLDTQTVARVLRYSKRRRAAEADLREAGARYRALFERAPDGILVVDDDGIVQDANLALAEMFGYQPDQLVGKPVEILLPEPVREAHVGLRREYAAHPVARPMGIDRSLTGRRKDGAVFPVEVGLAPLTFGHREAVVASVRDLTTAEERRRLADLVDASEDAILSVSLDGTVQSWNGGAERYLGRTRDAAVGHPLSSFLAPEVIEELPAILRRVRAGEHVRSVENCHIDENGRRVHLSFSFSPLTTRFGEVTGAGVIGRDITHQKILEADLEELAYQDPLTRVANRRFLRERLQYVLSLARREQYSVALVYVDLNGFKEVNDRFGHSAGDAILAEVAKRLKEVARESDLVARFGGDEFVVLLSKVESELGAVEAARRFEGTFDAPIPVGTDRDVTISAGFGIALYPDHGTEADQLLDAADRALYRRKEARWLAQAAPGMVVDRVGVASVPSMEGRLRVALEEAQLQLYGQPITRGADGVLAGVEVLLRWSRPESEILTANDFIPSARDLGLMPEIDHWVLSRVLRAARSGARPEGSRWFAVNLSEETLRSDEAVSSLASLIEETGLPEGGLRVEIRESPSLVNSHLLGRIERLRGLGVAVVLDNYGVGHSSIAQLSEMPADALKLDGLFVRTLERNAEAGRILNAAIELGVGAGMQVGVAGVERAAEADYLKSNGCDFLQGFYFGRPIPLGEIRAWSSCR